MMSVQMHASVVGVANVHVDAVIMLEAIMVKVCLHLYIHIPFNTTGLLPNS